MKNTYNKPAIKVVKVQIGNVLTQTSQLQLGSTVNNVSGDSRRGSRDNSWDDDEE